MIGETTAERIKMELGTAARRSEEGTTMRVRGRHLAAGMPQEITITQGEISEALAEPISQILGAVRTALENTAPELAADLVDTGIVLTGGGALLKGMDRALSEWTGLPVAVADDPLVCVANGAGRALENAEYRGVLAEA
jgi:rod shape-determining protein MreB